MKGKLDRVSAPTLGLLLTLLLAGCGHNLEPQSKPEKPGEIDVQTAAERYDLERDEALGGHTLKQHVGRTDEQLRERLQAEGNISAASTWTDRVTAEMVIAEALGAERGRIENWTRRGARRPNLALHYDTGRMIGRSMRRGETQPVDCTRAVIVLRGDGPESFYVLTSYPEDRAG